MSATIFGTDTARYQPLGTYDPGAFEIINIEDPEFEAKTARNLREGRPTGYYPWIYPGTDVRAFTTWAIAKARAAGSNFGAWADYEQDGVTLELLDQFFDAADAAGEKAGYYGNDWRFGHDRYLSRPFWLAGYPDPNDGQWRDGWAPQGSRSVQLWQFTSGGGMDRNVVWDEHWYTAWTGTKPAPAPTPPLDAHGGDMDMYVGKFDDAATIAADQHSPQGIPIPAHTPVALLVSPSGRIISTWAGPGPYDVPQQAHDWVSAGGRGRVNVITLDAPQMVRIVEADAAIPR